MPLERMKRKMDQSESTEYCLGLPPLPDLPDLVVYEILLNLPAHEIICVSLERCRREGFNPRVGDKSPKDWQLFYVLSKKRHNLLINAKEECEGPYEDGLNFEQNVDGGYARIFAPDLDITKTESINTYYFPVTKSHLIDLKKEGYNHALLDDIQPDIIISDWYTPTADRDGIYVIRVDLLDQKKKTVKTFDAPLYGDDNQMPHVFKNYGRGVRFIRFTHGGHDMRFLAGWDGIRVTNSSVEVHPEKDA